MNTEFVHADAGQTVRQVLARIRKVAEDIESIYYVYVLDASTCRSA